MTKEQIKQWLINDGQVPEGCENNEYWSHWYDVINRMLQGQSLPIDSVSQQRELLPEFLMKDLDGKIITAYVGGADVSKEWKEYLGNCGQRFGYAQ